MAGNYVHACKQGYIKTTGGQHYANAENQFTFVWDHQVKDVNWQEQFIKILILL